MRHLPLYVVVFISGAAVLTLELLGTRILGPYYGVSLFLWSALISVTLAALSVGYFIGGRMADRGATWNRLSTVLAAAAVWVLLIPWIKGPLLVLTDPLGLRTAVLIASTLLFFPPLLLLGIVSPYAIRLRAASLDEVGRTAGNLYAVSTIASVAGALATGFILIPSIGVNRLILSVGLALFLAAGIARLAGRRVGPALPVLLLIPAAGAALWNPIAEKPRTDLGILSITQSAYAQIRVYERNSERWMLIDGGAHTCAIPGSWKSVHRYAVVCDLVKNLFDAPGDLLLIGLGGGSVAKSYTRDGWDVTVSEIDPEVLRTAREYFGLTDDDGRVILEDGRRVLAESGTAYDAILFDAFGSSSIPFHLVTEECFGLAASRLKPGGVLGVNVEAHGWDDPIVHAFTATLKKHFDLVLALPTSEPPTALGNIVLLAANRPMEISDEELGAPFDYLHDDYLHWVVVQRNHAWDNRYEPATDGYRAMTDDLNPVDLWAERINREARKSLHEIFEKEGLNW